MTDGNPEHNGGAHRSLIAVQGVAYRYDGAEAPALHDISINVTEGSCFGLLGPNGAGKTTLISLLTGLLRVQDGRIRIGDRTFPGDAAAIKRMSALVPQEYAFYPTLTAQENLDFFAGLYEIPTAQRAARMEECIAVCSLQQVLHKRSESYSGGIKRRLNLAIGLLTSPRLLYLDEPTVGIDAQSRHFILAAIERLKERGMTIIYTSHYMEEVEQICDDVAIIGEGRVVLQESTSTLLQGGRQLYVTPTSVPEPAVLERLAAEVPAEWDGARFVLTPGAEHALSALLAALERHAVVVERMQMGGHRLEEIYLGVTRTELRV
ncbi:MAG: ABC transporter ATP-binding protein [Halioglobus sp.]|nr:ABC transporter ATP-binding protein [Halioglobus sp.]